MKYLKIPKISLTFQSLSSYHTPWVSPVSMSHPVGTATVAFTDLSSLWLTSNCEQQCIVGYQRLFYHYTYLSWYFPLGPAQFLSLLPLRPGLAWSGLVVSDLVWLIEPPASKAVGQASNPGANNGFVSQHGSSLVLFGERRVPKHQGCCNRSWVLTSGSYEDDLTSQTGAFYESNSL